MKKYASYTIIYYPKREYQIQYNNKKIYSSLEVSTFEPIIIFNDSILQFIYNSRSM